MNGNEPAFPVVEHQRDSMGEQRAETVAFGITIRQYFVAQAMNGVLAGFLCNQDLSPELLKDFKELISTYSIAAADACLAREAETRGK